MKIDARVSVKIFFGVCAWMERLIKDIIIDIYKVFGLMPETLQWILKPTKILVYITAVCVIRWRLYLLLFHSLSYFGRFNRSIPTNPGYH